MSKNNHSYSENRLTPSVYVFTTIIAFFSGVISAPLFVFLGNHYYDTMLDMGGPRVNLSLILFWLMLTIIFAILVSEMTGMNHVPVKTVATKAKPRSKRR